LIADVTAPFQDAKSGETACNPFAELSETPCILPAEHSSLRSLRQLTARGWSSVLEGDADPIVRCQSQLRKISVAAIPATAPRNFVENIALDSVAPDILSVVTDTNRRFAAAACARAATQLISGAAEMLTVPAIPLPRAGWSLSETGKRVLALDDHEIMLSFVTINGDVAELEV
jgi:hypothetical protein